MEIRNKQIISRSAAIFTGLIFIWSGVGKMVAADNFSSLIITYGLDFFSIFAPLIIFVELLVGLCLTFGLYQRQMSIVSICLLVIFTSAFMYGNLINGVEDCGCFGSYGIKTPVWVTYMRNVVLLVTSIIALNVDNNYYTQLRLKRLKICVASLLIICSFVIGYTWSLPGNWVTVLKAPNPLIGQEIKNTPLKDYADVKSDSTYIFWVFSYQCPSCMNSIANIKGYIDNDVSDYFIPLAVTDDEGDIMHKNLDIQFEAPNVGEKLSGFIKNLPTLIYVENSHIKYVIEGEAPSAYYFKQFYLESE